MKRSAGPLEIRRRNLEGFYNAYVVLDEEQGDDYRNLFAAAPEMLELLEEIRVEAISNADSCDHDLLSKLDKVIAKAKG